MESPTRSLRERGDSHGDHPSQQPAPRSATPTATLTQPATDPNAEEDDLLVEPNFATEEPAAEEIEQVQAQEKVLSLVADAAVKELPAVVELHRVKLVPSQEQQTGQEDFILPDLAQDLSVQDGFKSTRLGSTLDGTEKEPLDPLVPDLLQRLIDREIQQDPPAWDDTAATNPQDARVMATEKKRPTRTEKGKGVDSETPPRRQSNPSMAADWNTGSRSWLLQRGECSSALSEYSNQSPVFQARFRQREQEQQQQPRLQEPLNSTSLQHDARLTKLAPQTDEHGYQIVKLSKENSTFYQPNAADERRKTYMAHVRGKCLNCFSTDHRVAYCWRTSKCWRCMQPGHKAFSCPSRCSQFKHTTPEQPHLSNTLSFPPLSAPDTYPGDPRARPDRAICMISATGPIKRKRELLVGKTAVCWLNGNSRDTGPHHIIDALDEKLHISRHKVRVVKHDREQYLVFFSNYRAYHCAINHRDVRNRGRTFNFEPWSESRDAVKSKLEFRVRLRIEGVPVHAWSEEVAAQLIGQHCAIHYIEEQSRRQKRTRTYDLWAWSSNPSKIPKEVLLTITDPDWEQHATNTPWSHVELHHDPPTDFKGAYDYKLHIHLDVVEDLSFHHGNGKGDGRRKPRREFLWNYGVPDVHGERRIGQYNDDNATREYRPRGDRNDHDDNPHRGTRRHHSLSSWGRAAHCQGAMENPCKARDMPGQQTTWRKKNKGDKRVSFANPLVQILGQPSKASRILDMLNSAAGWSPVASPVGCDGAGEEMEEGEVQDIRKQPSLTNKLPITNEKSQVCQEPKTTHFSEVQSLEIEVEDEMLGNMIHNTSVCNTNKPAPSAQHIENNDLPSTDTPTISVANNIAQPVGHAIVTEGEGDRSSNGPNDASGNEITNIASSNGEGNKIDDFAAFIDFISCKPAPPLVSTPPRVNPPQPVDHPHQSTTTQRKSTRLADKAKLNPGKDTIQMAQRVLINKLGELSPKSDESIIPDFDTLAQHLPKPLNGMKMEAIRTLVEQGNKPKNRKRSKIAPVQAGEAEAQVV